MLAPTVFIFSHDEFLPRKLQRTFTTCTSSCVPRTPLCRTKCCCKTKTFQQLFIFRYRQKIHQFFSCYSKYSCDAITPIVSHFSLKVQFYSETSNSFLTYRSKLVSVVFPFVTRNLVVTPDRIQHFSFENSKYFDCIVKLPAFHLATQLAVALDKFQQFFHFHTYIQKPLFCRSKRG